MALRCWHPSGHQARITFSASGSKAMIAVVRGREQEPAEENSPLEARQSDDMGSSIEARDVPTDREPFSGNLIIPQYSGAHCGRPRVVPLVAACGVLYCRAGVLRSRTCNVLGGPRRRVRDCCREDGIRPKF